MKVTYLTDDKGNPSSMRMMAAGALLIAGALALLPMLPSVEANSDATLIGMFLTAAFGGKIWQKTTETKSNQSEE